MKQEVLRMQEMQTQPSWWQIQNNPNLKRRRNGIFDVNTGSFIPVLIFYDVGQYQGWFYSLTSFFVGNKFCIFVSVYDFVWGWKWGCTCCEWWVCVLMVRCQFLILSTIERSFVKSRPVDILTWIQIMKERWASQKLDCISSLVSVHFLSLKLIDSCYTLWI